MVLELRVIASECFTNTCCVFQTLMSVRKTLVLVESASITRARTPVSAESATRARSPGPSAEVWS